MNLNKHINFFDPTDNTETIHIIGVGATGSNLAHVLTRLGFNDIILYDFDTLTAHNMTNQYYKANQIGELKTESLKANLLEINPDINITLEKEGYIEQDLYGYVFLCLDNIDTRRKIVEQNRLNFNIKFLTDIRIGLEEGQMYAIKPDLKTYKSLLETMDWKHGESKVERNACGTELNILPTIQTIVSLSITNLINFMKYETYDTLRVIDSIQSIARGYKFK